VKIIFGNSGTSIYSLLKIPLLFSDRHPLNDLFSKTTWVRWYAIIVLLNYFTETRDGEVTVASAGPCANNLQLAPDG